jgi:hypothetical protein
MFLYICKHIYIHIAYCMYEVRIAKLILRMPESILSSRLDAMRAILEEPS